MNQQMLLEMTHLEAKMEIGMMKEMIDDGILREDAMSVVPGFKPVKKNIFRRGYQ